MKKLSLIICLLLLIQNSFCQEKALSIENSVSHKEIGIKENKRIKVLTKTGEKFAGRFMVLDQNSIVVNGVILNLNEIGTIKKHPLLDSIMIHLNIFHSGTITIMVAAAFLCSPLVLVGMSIVVCGVYGVNKSPNVKKAYKVENNWVFKIKGLPESNAAIEIAPLKL